MLAVKGDRKLFPGKFRGYPVVALEVGEWASGRVGEWASGRVGVSGLGTRDAGLWTGRNRRAGAESNCLHRGQGRTLTDTARTRARGSASRVGRATSQSYSADEAAAVV